LAVYTQVEDPRAHASPRLMKCTMSRLRCTQEGTWKKKTKRRPCTHKSKANVYRQNGGFVSQLKVDVYKGGAIKYGPYTHKSNAIVYRQVQDLVVHTSPMLKCTSTRLRCTKEGKSKTKPCTHKSKADVHTYPSLGSKHMSKAYRYQFQAEKYKGG